MKAMHFGCPGVKQWLRMGSNLYIQGEIGTLPPRGHVTYLESSGRMGPEPSSPAFKRHFSEPSESTEPLAKPKLWKPCAVPWYHHGNNEHVQDPGSTPEQQKENTPNL